MVLTTFEALAVCIKRINNIIILTSRGGKGNRYEIMVNENNMKMYDFKRNREVIIISNYNNNGNNK